MKESAGAFRLGQTLPYLAGVFSIAVLHVDPAVAADVLLAYAFASKLAQDIAAVTRRVVACRLTQIRGRKTVCRCPGSIPTVAVHPLGPTECETHPASLESDGSRVCEQDLLATPVLAGLSLLVIISYL